MSAILIGIFSLLMLIVVLATTFTAVMIFVAWIIGLVAQSRPRMLRSTPSVTRA